MAVLVGGGVFVGVSFDQPSDCKTRYFRNSIKQNVWDKFDPDKRFGLGNGGNAVAQPMYLYIVVDSAAPGSTHGSLTERAIAASVTGNTGWTIGTNTGYSLLVWNSHATVFAAPAQPANPPTTSDCFRTENKYTRTFAAGTFAISLGLEAQIASGATVALSLRLWRSSDPTGQTGITEITSGAVATTSVTTSSTPQSLTASVTVPSFALNGEYLFLQLAVQSTAGVASADAVFLQNSQSKSIADIITTTFTEGAAVSSNGTLAVTLGTLTAAATGTVAIAATAAPTLGALTSAATATVAIAASESSTLGAATSAATGAVAIAASEASTLGTLAAASSGTVAIAAAGASTLGALTSSSAGTVAIAGAASPTLGAAISSATGTIAIAASEASTLGVLTSAATGALTDAAIESTMLGALNLAATGTTTSSINGIAAVTLDAATMAATGTLTDAGADAGVLDPLTLSATATNENPLPQQSQQQQPTGGSSGSDKRGKRSRGRRGDPSSQYVSRPATAQAAISFDAMTCGSAGVVLVESVPSTVAVPVLAAVSIATPVAATPIAETIENLGLLIPLPLEIQREAAPVIAIVQTEIVIRDRGMVGRISLASRVRRVSRVTRAKVK